MINRTGTIARVLLFMLITNVVTGCQLPALMLDPVQPPPTTTAAPISPSHTPTLSATTQPEPSITPTASPTAGVVESIPEPVENAVCPVDLENRAVREIAEVKWTKLDALTCYQLTLDLTGEDPTQYTGSARVTYTNTTGDVLDDLVFRVYPNAPVIYGGRLEITSAAITEAEVAPEVFLEDQTAVRIPLLQSLQPGETITVHLEFSGQTPENFGSSRVYGIFNYDPLNEVLILANWYPILAVRSGGDWEAVEVSSIGDAVNSDTAVFQLTVQAQQGWKLITTGTELKDQTENDGNVMEFISGPVRDFMLVASPAFIPEEIPFEDVTITHWQLPNIEYPDTTTEVAHASMQIFTDRFGVYPYTELDIVDVPLQNAGGVEYPGLILVEQGLYQRPQSADYLKVVVAHEVGHQWWYSVVGNDVYENPWQDEALATFSALLYFQQHDVQYYRGLLSYYRDSVTQFESQYGQTPIAQPVTAFENAPGSAYSDIVYFKGALFFVALRDEIGDEAFFRALNSYYQTGMFSITSPEVLLRAFERSCGCDLSAFYADWGVIGQ